MSSKAEGWTVEGKTATFNGGTFGQYLVCGKAAGGYWSYTATVTIGTNGLTVEVSDDDDRGGMAHGGSCTELTIPLDVLTQLLES